MAKRLANGTIKTLASSIFQPDAPTIESFLIAKRLLRLATVSSLPDALGDRTAVPLLMFDLDGTLIRTKSGRLFAKDAADWHWLFELKKIRDTKALCVIVSNQAGKIALDTIQERIRQVMTAMKVPVIALAALDRDQYRKPDIGIWEHLVDYLHDHHHVVVDIDKSLFVGDAAGRLQSGNNGKPDFSYSDRAFAFNIGIKFQTPEEYFEGHDPVPYQMPDPVRFLKDAPDTIDDVVERIGKGRAEVEILLLVGWPGAGKSTFRARHLSSYVVVSQDLLKSQAKCMKVGLQALQQGKSICVDNTNYRKATRLEWVKISQRAEIACPVRVLHFQADRQLAEHLNCVRHARAVRRGQFDGKIPDVAYHTYAKHYVAPDLDEGYREIIPIPFVPRFDSEDDQRLFKRIY